MGAHSAGAGTQHSSTHTCGCERLVGSKHGFNDGTAEAKSPRSAAQHVSQSASTLHSRSLPSTGSEESDAAGESSKSD